MGVREEFRADVKQVGLAVDDGFGRRIKILVDGSGLQKILGDKALEATLNILMSTICGVGWYVYCVCSYLY